MPIPEFGRHELIGDEVEYRRDDNAAPKNPWSTGRAAGAEEYAIYGWYKWTPADKGAWPNLFRVS